MSVENMKVSQRVTSDSLLHKIKPPRRHSNT